MGCAPVPWAIAGTRTDLFPRGNALGAEPLGAGAQSKTHGGDLCVLREDLEAGVRLAKLS